MESGDDTDTVTLTCSTESSSSSGSSSWVVEEEESSSTDSMEYESSVDEVVVQELNVEFRVLLIGDRFEVTHSIEYGPYSLPDPFPGLAPDAIINLKDQFDWLIGSELGCETDGIVDEIESKIEEQEDETS